MLIADSDFVKCLADSAKQPGVRVIIAEDSTSDLKDEARQTAVAYWMAGYNWNEIEAVLEDSEYADHIVSYAVNKAKEYAKEMLKDGPFSIFDDGQKVKLSNGAFGILTDKREDYVSVKTATDGVLQVVETQIDKEASLLLRKAYKLRKEAEKIMVAQEDPATKEFKTYIKEKAPSGYGEQTPFFQQTPSVETVLPETITRELARLEAMEARVADLAREKEEYQKLAKDIHEEIKTVDDEKADIAQRLFGEISEELEILEDIGFSVFMRTKDKFLLLDRVLTQRSIPPDALKKLDAVTTFLKNKYPEIISEVDSLLDAFEQENTVIKSHVREMLALYPPSHKKLKSTAQLSKVKDWIVQRWLSVKSWIENWQTKLKPELDSGLNAIDDFANSVTSSAIASRVLEKSKV